MSRLNVLLKRRTLVAGFVAVLVPLVLLVVLQLVWLRKLERASAIANRAALSNYLEAVGTEIQYFYRSQAQRALNVPGSLFTQGRLDKVAQYWKKKPVRGVRRLFLVDFTRTTYGNFLVYDPEKHELFTPPASDESLAIIVATSPWQMITFRERTLESPAITVDERDPENRIVLNPITDEDSLVVGMAGMVLDEEFFVQELLPEVSEHALPEFFPDRAARQVALAVHDARGRPVYQCAEFDATGTVVESHFPFVFTDWTVSLQSARTTPEQWARANFAFNITLSAVLCLAVVGGAGLALRSANRVMVLSEMKSDFVSNVSHELRTPLASIRVFAEFLKLGRAQSPEKVREYGEYIEAESRRLSRLIDNILDFSKIESGRKTYTFVPCDVGQLVSSVVRTFAVRLEPMGFRVDLERPEEPLPSMTIDPDAIGQAVHNLLDNALKYSGESKEIRVSVRLTPESVVISVQDHGIGIAKDEQRKVFERFHRVSTGLVHDVKGSGLGLSIVNHVVQAHRGRITLRSEPGRGSTFSIHLPRTLSGAPASEIRGGAGDSSRTGPAWIPGSS